jgi:hypothetical protein
MIAKRAPGFVVPDLSFLPEPVTEHRDYLNTCTAALLTR